MITEGTITEDSILCSCLLWEYYRASNSCPLKKTLTTLLGSQNPKSSVRSESEGWEVGYTRKDPEGFLSDLIFNSVHLNWLCFSWLLHFKRTLKALLTLMGDKVQQTIRMTLSRVCLWRRDRGNYLSVEKVHIKTYSWFRLRGPGQSWVGSVLDRKIIGAPLGTFQCI